MSILNMNVDSSIGGLINLAIYSICSIDINELDGRRLTSFRHAGLCFLPPTFNFSAINPSSHGLVIPARDATTYWTSQTRCKCGSLTVYIHGKTDLVAVLNPVLYEIRPVVPWDHWPYAVIMP